MGTDWIDVGAITEGKNLSTNSENKEIICNFWLEWLREYSNYCQRVLVINTSKCYLALSFVVLKTTLC